MCRETVLFQPPRGFCNNFVVTHRPMVILEIGVAVLVAIFFLVYLATRLNPPKDPFFYGKTQTSDNSSNSISLPAFIQVKE